MHVAVDITPRGSQGGPRSRGGRGRRGRGPGGGGGSGKDGEPALEGGNFREELFVCGGGRSRGAYSPGKGVAGGGGPDGGEVEAEVVGEGGESAVGEGRVGGDIGGDVGLESRKGGEG